MKGETVTKEMDRLEYHPRATKEHVQLIQKYLRCRNDLDLRSIEQRLYDRRQKQKKLAVKRHRIKKD